MLAVLLPDVGSSQIFITVLTILIIYYKSQFHDLSEYDRVLWNHGAFSKHFTWHCFSVNNQKRYKNSYSRIILIWNEAYRLPLSYGKEKVNHIFSVIKYGIKLPIIEALKGGIMSADLVFLIILFPCVSIVWGDTFITGRFLLSLVSCSRLAIMVL